jgi:hypothetical protein
MEQIATEIVIKDGFICIDTVLFEQIILEALNLKLLKYNTF